MQELGRIVRLDGKNAIVKFRRRSECDSCRRCKVCGDSVSVEAEVSNSLSANVGDYVLVKFDNRKFAGATLGVYSVPLILAAVGCFVGSVMSGGAMAILGISGIIVGLAVAIPIDVCVLKKRNKMRMISFADPSGSAIYSDSDLSSDNAAKHMTENARFDLKNAKTNVKVVKTPHKTSDSDNMSSKSLDNDAAKPSYAWDNISKDSNNDASSLSAEKSSLADGEDNT